MANRLAHKYKFGYFDIDDVKQEAIRFAIIALESYNESLPLENFLFVSVKNRLYNLKRNHLKQHEPPCFRCPHFDEHYNKSDNQCLQFLNKNNCDLFVEWQCNTTIKQSLIAPRDITNINDEYEDNMKLEVDVGFNIDRKELFDKIDAKLDTLFRADWLRLRAGVSIPKNRKLKVIEAVREILGICPKEKPDH